LEKTGAVRRARESIDSNGYRKIARPSFPYVDREEGHGMEREGGPTRSLLRCCRSSQREPWCVPAPKNNKKKEKEENEEKEEKATRH
jgi:hypothetical protein